MFNVPENVNSSPALDLVNEVIRKYGGAKGVKERFNYSTIEAVYMWRTRGKLPKSKLAEIHLDTGIPLSKLTKYAA
jgi:hypothetical protein